MLWVQDKRADGNIDFKKAWGTANPADLMTKYNLWPTMERHLAAINAYLRDGRAKLSSEVSKGI